MARQQSEDDTREHLPSCGDHCAAGCEMTPRYAPPVGCRRASLDAPMVFTEGERSPRARTLHTGPVPAQKPAPPLWERVTDWGCVETLRRFEVRVPQPDAYQAHERADERYSLDRWTRPGGLADEALDAVHVALAAERKSRARARDDIADIAARLHAAFPALRAGGRRTLPKATTRAGMLFAALLGEDDAAALIAADERHGARAGAQHDPIPGVRGIYIGLVWGLALVLFGRESDPLSDYALGRMLPGAPIKDQRPPFASAAHVLAAASAPMPGLGGGSCPWPQDDPRMARRTWSKPDEMAVKGTFAGTTRIRGEEAAHRVLSARAAVNRAALTRHERAMVEALNDRKATRDEKAMRLRAIEAERLGIDVPGLVSDASRRKWEVDGALWKAEHDRLHKAYKDAQDEAASLKAHAELCDALRERTIRDDAHRAASSAARPALLRAATRDVSDGDLFAMARAAQKRLVSAVERVSVAGDALAPRRPEKARPVRAVHAVAPLRLRAPLASEVLAL